MSRAATVTVLVALVVQFLPSASSAADVVDVAARDFFFEPRTQRVDVGDSVRWTNLGQDWHTVTADDGTFDQTIRPGEVFEVPFEQPRTVAYFCQFHAGMDGEVVVADARTDAPVFGEEGPPFERLAGGDAVDAAIAWSRFRFDDGQAPTVLLARADVFADALSSGGAQGALAAPLLLTPPRAADPRVAAELDRLGATKVVVFGGEAAGVHAYGRPVERIAGASRVETAVRAAQTFAPGRRDILVARASADGADPTRAWADAVAAGAVSARTGRPVLLTASGKLSAATRDHVRTAGVGDIVVVGGPGAVTDAVVRELEALGARVSRAGGANRFDTAAALARLAFSDAAPKAGLLLEAAAPDAWASGFAAAATAAEGAVVLLSAGADLPASSTSRLLLERLPVVCGPLVTDSACARAETAASAAPVSDPQLVAVAQPQSASAANRASAFIVLKQTSDPRALCFQYRVYDSQPRTLHVHASASASGEAVVPLDGLGLAAGCAFALDEQAVRSVFTNPGRFVADVHDATSVVARGPLFEPTGEIVAELTGGNGSPAAGAAGAHGVFAAMATGHPDELCVDEHLAGLDETVTATHVHRAGEPDDVVFSLPNPANGGQGPAACVDGLDPALVNDLFVNPQHYDAHVHTQRFPDGAASGRFALVR